MHMGNFDKYKGLFAGEGSFDIPANYGLGVAFTPARGWTLAADWQHIGYSGVPAVGNPSAAAAPLGAGNGPGFGWRDVDVFKLGVAWQMDAKTTLRAGYNHGDNPIRSQDVTFNILAPGVMKDHFTAGFTYALDAASELTGAFMYAPSNSVSGPSLFNAVLGPGAGGNETIRMHQYSIGVAWSRRF
jgi:long-chain fatty acid transport protein